VAVAIGAVVLIGWWTGATALTSFHLGLVAMMFNTGVCVVLAGASLLLEPVQPRAPGTASTLVLVGMALVLIDLRLGRSRYPAQWLAATAAVLSLLFAVSFQYGTNGRHAIPGFAMATAGCDLVAGAAVE
jgi:hypothetical protein